MLSAKVSLIEIHDQWYTGDKYTIHAINDAWDVNTVCWNNKPTEGPTLSKGTNDGEVFDFDVTSVMQSMIDNPSSNHGFMIKTVVNQAQGHFASVENGSARGPQLILELDSEAIMSVENDMQTSGLQVVKDQSGSRLYLPFDGLCELSAVSLQGRELFSKSTIAQNSWIALPEQSASGIYILQVTFKGMTYALKVNH